MASSCDARSVGDGEATCDGGPALPIRSVWGVGWRPACIRSKPYDDSLSCEQCRAGRRVVFVGVPAGGGPASYLYGLAEVSNNQSFPELHGQVAPAMRDEKELLSFLDICSAPRRFDLHERDVIVAVILVTLFARVGRTRQRTKQL